MLGADDVSDPGRRSRSESGAISASIPSTPSPSWWPRAEPDLVLGHHQAVGATYFYLYVVLDIFSRYAVGWMVADRENSALAGRLIEETCRKQGVQPQVLTLHSDRGAPMTSKCTAQLLADNTDQVSDGQFKTLKYHPGFPGRFHDITGIAFCRTFFPWYNTEHRHGDGSPRTTSITIVLEQRGRTLQAAWTRHPERFVRGIPQPHPLPQAVWINPPVPQQEKLLSKSQSSLSQSVDRFRRGLACQPAIVGVGLGGSKDTSMVLGKQAACLRTVGDRNPDPRISALELELRDLGNNIGMGAMGFIGTSMVVDCHIEVAHTHTGGMPMSVHMFCLSSRRATARVQADGTIELRTDPRWFTPYARRETVEWTSDTATSNTSI